jgi:hypothetical protein
MKPTCAPERKPGGKLNLKHLESLNSEKLAGESLLNHACLLYMLEETSAELELAGYESPGLERANQLALIAGLFTRLLIQRLENSAPEIKRAKSDRWRELYFAALAERDSAEAVRKIGAVEREITRHLNSDGRSLAIEEMRDLQFALYTLERLQQQTKSKDDERPVNIRQLRYARK